MSSNKSNSSASNSTKSIQSAPVRTSKIKSLRTPKKCLRKTAIRRASLTQTTICENAPFVPTQAEQPTPAVETVPSAPAAVTMPTNIAPKAKTPPPTEDVVTRVEEWLQPEHCQRMLDASEDDMSETSASASDMASVSTFHRRQSLLFTTSRGVGVTKDMATNTANEAFLTGKEALETSRNMRTDLKNTVLESLQNLYEIVLSLSDSRHRHRCNLEAARASHAKELVRVERAHNRAILDLTSSFTTTTAKLTAELEQSNRKIEEFRNWLEFEAEREYKRLETSDKTIQLISHNVNSIKKQVSEAKEESCKKTIDKIKNCIDINNQKLTTQTSLSDGLRQDVAKLAHGIEEIAQMTRESTAPKSPGSAQSTPTKTPATQREMAEIHQELGDLRNLLQEVANTVTT